MKKNILTTLLLTTAMLFSAGASAQKTTSLFNGKDLSNWKFILQDNSASADQVFSVKDNLIHITGKPIGYMYTNEAFGDCKIHVEWRWPGGVMTNSGIFLLVADPKNPFPNGVECQLQAGNAGDLIAEGGATLAEYKTDAKNPNARFKMVKKYAASSEKAAGEWNEANIFIINGVMTIYINNILQNIGTNPNKEGAIGLQSEGGDIEFRNVTVTSIE